MSSNDSEKIVPPKKSKAARKTEEKKEEAASNHDGEETDKAKESEAEKNIFNEEPIIEGKRKRNNPASEQFAKEWLQKHLVEAELSLILFTSDIYKCYVESCTSNGGISLLEGEFIKVLHSIFPKGYALAPDCPYKDAVRKKKVQKSTTKVVQAESLQLKMKDIIIDSIMSLGNPRRGVSMNAMKNFVSGKHPALRLDQREGNFKKVISNLLRFKKIDCVRGIGACGFYRMPRTPEEEEAEIAKEKQETKEKLKRKKEKQVALKKKQEEKEGRTEEEGDGDKVMEVDVDDVTEDGNKGEKRDHEEERGDGDAGAREASGQPVEVEEGETQEEKQADAKKDKNKKKKKKVKKPSSSSSREFLDFENPSKIEDTFPLAMTYNCEPKEASIVKITKYVTDFYQQDLSNKEKLKKCLETGMEKGFWTQVTGTSSGSGTYRLTIEEFDPNADSDLTGMIMNAIVACTEPKISSASLLKKYIQEYHPGLKVVEQPRKFKQALLRAISANKIKQLSGIGATGSFQLLQTFRPSPSTLQGKSSASWPSSAEGEDDEDEIGGTDVEDGGLELYQDAYKPRPSKRRGMGRAVETTKVSRLDLSSYPSLKKLKANGSSNGISSRRSATQGRGRASSLPKKSVKRPALQEDEDEEEEEEESEDEKDDSEPEYEPKKSRGGRSAIGRGGKKSVTKKNQQMAAPKPVKASKTVKTLGASPKTKKAKLSKASSPPEKLEARAAKKRVSYAEAEDDDDDEDEEDDEEDKEEDSKALNMASSPKKGVAAQKRQPRSQPLRNQRSSVSSIQQVSIILDRELENQLPATQKNSGKGARPARAEASPAVANGSKSSPRKAKKGFKGKKKLRGKH